MANTSSEERRIAGVALEQAYNWQGGVYYWDENSSDAQDYELTNFLRLLDGKLEIGLGVRRGRCTFRGPLGCDRGVPLTSETKKIFKESLDGGGERNDHGVMWRGGVRFERRLFDGLLHASTGFRSGGFSARAETLPVL